MSIRRFNIKSRLICDGYASFDGDVYNHMVRVLRLGPGDLVQLVDETGTIHNGVINQVGKEWVAVKISTSMASTLNAVTAPRITVCQALPKGEKLDFILQKGTELGTQEFCLFGGRRSVAKVRSDQISDKLERWQRITAEASRQCGRTDIPSVSWYPSADEVLKDTTQELRLLLWEGEKGKALKGTLSENTGAASIIVAIGPEGGFDPSEVLLFSQHGFKSVSLGSRILRTETASIAILSILQYTLGDM